MTSTNLATNHVLICKEVTPAASMSVYTSCASCVTPLLINTDSKSVYLGFGFMWYSFGFSKIYMTENPLARFLFVPSCCTREATDTCYHL